MLARSQSATPWGLEARPVQVEADVRLGKPQFQILGLSDVSARECRERVRSAIRASGHEMPPRSILIRLAPGDLPKQSRYLDLPVAAALLAGLGELCGEDLEGRCLAGELGFDGSLRPVPGALSIAELAQHEGCRELLLPAASAAEAAALEALPVVPVRSLTEAVGHLRGSSPIAPLAPSATLRESQGRPVDLSDVHGLEQAKRVLEVAAAGAHHLILIAPPGAGRRFSPGDCRGSCRL